MSESNVRATAIAPNPPNPRARANAFWWSIWLLCTFLSFIADDKNHVPVFPEVALGRWLGSTVPYYVLGWIFYAAVRGSKRSLTAKFLCFFAPLLLIQGSIYVGDIMDRKNATQQTHPKQ
jgi:hypothetical protein